MSFFQPCDKMASIQRDKTNYKKSTTIDLIQVTKRMKGKASIHMHHEFLLAP
jgi:hypothetical protein